MLGFRVWDVEKKRFMDTLADYVHLSLDMEGLVRFCESKSGGLLCTKLDPELYVPMQSTGLKDKDGVMIYEGDILSTLVEDKYVLVTETIGFAIFYGDGLVDHKMPCFAVIGNRFENPELLEKVK